MDRNPFYTIPIAAVAVIGAAYGLQRWRSMITTKSAEKTSGDDVFDSALLVLSVPSYLDPKTILRNDELLSKTLKRVKSSLHVMINFPEPTATLLSYASDMYATMWDLMLEHNKLSLDCKVYTNLDQLEHVASSVDVIFCDKYTDLPDNFTTMTLLSQADICPEQYDYLFVDTPMQTISSFPRVALGGTFDHLHNGHRRLLTIASTICTEKLTVGITSDAMLSGKKAGANLLQDYQTRASNVTKFMQDICPSLKLNVVQLSDGLGPPATEENFDAILVSSETIKGALMINEAREQKEMKPLHICICRRQSAATLSSTFIRQHSR